MPLVSLSLKQKLSNLALSQSTPTSPSSGSERGKSSFNPFNRRNTAGTVSGAEDGPDTIDDHSLDEIMQRVIRQAGVDYE